MVELLSVDLSSKDTKELKMQYRKLINLLSTTRGEAEADSKLPLDTVCTQAAPLAAP